MSRAEPKSVVKKIAAREIFEVFLADDRYASGMGRSLESIGGQVSLRRTAGCAAKVFLGSSNDHRQPATSRPSFHWKNQVGCAPSSI
ncbi:hypothetical protein [Comamonas sp. BIGb0152]|uniref:hypothetical protein n=1 Tax=Comamonas sp. BIGb0152 TaxID=2940601 RepID=UPI002167F305|nr:hypothetical protein [Comamonas sp. BIGb0152]